MQRPLPTPNADSKPFWEACEAGSLQVQRCTGCERFQFPPRGFCTDCRSTALDWVTVSGRARIASFSVVHRAPIPALKEDTPYVLALVDLEEGPRLMTNIIECDPASVHIDQKVRFVFRHVSPDAPRLPYCVPDVRSV